MWTLSPAELAVVLLSLKVAACSVLVLVLPAIGMAWLLARKQFWGHALVDALVHLPMVLPPVVLGYMLLVLLGRRGWIGAWLYE